MTTKVSGDLQMWSKCQQRPLALAIPVATLDTFVILDVCATKFNANPSDQVL